MILISVIRIHYVGVALALANLELKCVYFLSLNSHFDKAVYLLNQMALHLHTKRLNIHFYLFAFKTWRKFYYGRCLKNTIQIKAQGTSDHAGIIFGHAGPFSSRDMPGFVQEDPDIWNFDVSIQFPIKF